MGRHLVDPFRHAGIRIAREDGHRPFVVARTLLRIPGRGIAGAVIDEVQAGIIGHPAPGAAAADLPLIALPGLQARILADRLAKFGGLLGVDQDLIVRSLGVGPPDLLADLEIVGGDVALHAELAAGDADQHLVLDHERRRGAGLALAGIAVLRAPRDLAGLGVERDQRGVGLVQEDLAVAIGDAAVNRVAAHHRDDVRILLGLVLPDDLVRPGKGQEHRPCSGTACGRTSCCR